MLKRRLRRPRPPAQQPLGLQRLPAPDLRHNPRPDLRLRRHLPHPQARRPGPRPAFLIPPAARLVPARLPPRRPLVPRRPGHRRRRRGRRGQGRRRAAVYGQRPHHRGHRAAGRGAARLRRARRGLRRPRQEAHGRRGRGSRGQGRVEEREVPHLSVRRRRGVLFRPHPLHLQVTTLRPLSASTISTLQSTPSGENGFARG